MGELDGTTLAIITGTSVGGVVLVSLIVTVACVCVKRSSRKPQTAIGTQNVQVPLPIIASVTESAAEAHLG